MPVQIAPMRPTTPAPVSPPMVIHMPTPAPTSYIPGDPPMIIQGSPSSESETSSRESPYSVSKALSQQIPMITIIPAPQKPPKVKYPRKPRKPSPESPRTIYVQPRTPSPESPGIIYVQPRQTPSPRTPSRTPFRIAVEKPSRSKASRSESRTVDDHGRRDSRYYVPRSEETVRNNTDAYRRKRHSDEWSIERLVGWPDSPPRSSSPVYIVAAPTDVHQATPHWSTSHHHGSSSTSRSNATVGATPRFEETIKNNTDPYYSRRRRSNERLIERARVPTVVDTWDWSDAPSSPVYIVPAPTNVHQATPHRSTSLHHSSISTFRSNTTVGVTSGANDVRMTRSSSVRHGGASTSIAPGNSVHSSTEESVLSSSSRTTMSAGVGSLIGIRANPSPRSSLAL
jgi:hypothetical protein